MTKRRKLIPTSMKLLRNSILSLVLLASATAVMARPQLHKLDIRVVLSKNGDARITETRQMTIDGEGTECYIGLGNMGPSTVNNLTVSDETGRQFENVGGWDVNRDRSWKAGRCGIVEKSDGGYELCWGLGDAGERTYITSYTFTGMVRAYPDADALRHVFLDADVSPKPEYARVTIMGADSTLKFQRDTCGIWGFRFYGELSYQDGTIVAETTQPMNSTAALYIMAAFPKGMFQPDVTEDDTFEHKRQQAFEGSDYAEGESKDDTADFLIGLFAFLFSVLTPLGIWFWSAFGNRIKAWNARRKLGDIAYCKTIPLEGNLQQANDLLNAYTGASKRDYNRLLSASILKLIHQGAFSVKPVMTKKGTMEKRFIVNALPSTTADWPLGRKMHEIFKRAAGNDNVLDPRELQNYMSDTKNSSLTRNFITLLRTHKELSFYKNRQHEVQEVVGFKKFLEDFTLMDERQLQEVKLWKDYLVWATLFGNAKQVVKDMKKVNPEYFNMDQLADQMADNVVLPTVFNCMYRSSRDLLTLYEPKPTTSSSHWKGGGSSRSWGGGGHSSWGGGGGGFSGGGGGGGVR